MNNREESAYERMLVAAAKLFAQQGFEGTTTRQIVAEAGSSLSSLQLHFQSKECLYQAVIERTLNTFYALNAPIIEEIVEAEKSAILERAMAWDLIVQLTSQIVEWASNEKYTNEILLINREILKSGESALRLPKAVYGLYDFYEMLIERYTGQKDQFWIRVLSFTIVSSAFDYSNYRRVLNHVLRCDVTLPENRAKLKMHMKNYLLTSLRANINVHQADNSADQ